MRYNRSNIKVSFTGEPFFTINESEKTITCTLKANLVTPVPVQDDVPANSEAFIYGAAFSVVAKAKCSKNDVFDIERGKRIAMAKAENKIYAAAEFYLRKMRKSFAMMVTAIDDFNKKAVRCAAHNLDYIDTLSMQGHPNYVKDVKPCAHTNQKFIP
jgi:hypothetical protein